MREGNNQAGFKYEACFSQTTVCGLGTVRSYQRRFPRRRPDVGEDECARDQYQLEFHRELGKWQSDRGGGADASFGRSHLYLIRCGEYLDFQRAAFKNLDCGRRFG